MDISETGKDISGDNNHNNPGSAILSQKNLEPITTKEWFVTTLFFIALIILMTWPLLINFSTSVPDGSVEDRYRNLWNLWWIKRSVFNIDNPYRTPMLYYPYFGPSNPLPLYFQDLQLLNGLLTLPFQLLGGVAAAYNGIIFISFTASGVGAYALARLYTRSKIAAGLAGILFAYGPIHLNTIFTSITNIMSVQYLPFYVFFLHLFMRRGYKRYVVGAAISLAACIYTDWYNTFYLLFYTAFYFLGRLLIWKRLQLKEILRQSGKLVLPGVIGVILSLPLLLPTFANLNNPIFFTQLGLDRDLRASVALFTMLNPTVLFGFLFWCGLITGGFLLWKDRQHRARTIYWLSFYLLCWLFALGPRLQLTIVKDSVSAEAGLPLPYALLKYIPGISSTRAPERFLIPAQMALAVLVALTAAYLLENLGPAVKKVWQAGRFSVTLNPTNAAIAALAVIYLLVNSSLPLNLVAVQPYGFVSNVLEKDNTSYHLMELPITRHYQFDHPFMYNQIWHNQPIMGAFLGRPLIDPFRDFNSPYRWLAQQEYYPADFAREIFSEQEAFNIVANLALIDRYKYIVIYKDIYRTDQERNRIKEIITNQLGSKALIYEDSQNAVYLVPAADQLAKSLKGPGLWLGDGFYDPESNAQGNYRWMQPQADFYFVKAGAGKVNIKFDTLAFAKDRRLKISFNNQQIFDGVITSQQKEISFDLDAPDGTSQIHLESLDGATTPASLGQGNDNRSLSFLIKNLMVSNLP